MQPGLPVGCYEKFVETCVPGKGTLCYELADFGVCALCVYVAALFTWHLQLHGGEVRVEETWRSRLLTVSSLAVLAFTSRDTMANWFYYDKKGEKISVSGGQLKGLAKAGVITPETIVETEDGKTAPARKVKGLTFVTIPQETSPPELNPFATSSDIHLDTAQSQRAENILAVPVPIVPVMEETKKTNPLRNPVICVILGFVGGLIVMFTFDCIYCSRESYRQAVAAKFFQEKMVEGLAGFAKAFAEDEDAKENIDNKREEVDRHEPKQIDLPIDPRLDEFVIENFRIREEDNQFSFEVSFNFYVQNNTGKVIKAFSADVEVKEPGRTVPLITKGFSHSPAGGIEAGERKSFSLSPNMFMEWNKLQGKTLNTLLITVTVDSITFHDGEQIRR